MLPLEEMNSEAEALKATVLAMRAATAAADAATTAVNAATAALAALNAANLSTQPVVGAPNEWKHTSKVTEPVCPRTTKRTLARGRRSSYPVRG